jgi:hypothetical protein
MNTEQTRSHNSEGAAWSIGTNSESQTWVSGSKPVLRALIARDRAVETWLTNQVGPAYDALKADRSRAVTADQVRARLAAEHAKAQ